MSQQALDRQHYEVKERNRQRRVAEMAEAERLRALRRGRCGR